MAEANEKIVELHQLFMESAGVCTDTRKIVKDSLFFALKGASFNGNDFALQALEQGAKYAVVDNPALLERACKISQVEVSYPCAGSYRHKW